jgi:hypothetical protein
VDETVSEWYPVAGFGISGVDSSYFAVRKLTVTMARTEIGCVVDGSDCVLCPVLGLGIMRC